MPDPLHLVERALTRIRRNVAKRVFGRILQHEIRDVDLSIVGVVDALSEGDASVGAIGDKLGVDPSRASRLVAAAVDAGHVLRVASQQDGRRIDLTLTDRGAELVERVRSLRRAWAGAAMKHWTAAERKEFARLLDAFVDALPEPPDGE